MGADSVTNSRPGYRRHGTTRSKRAIAEQLRRDLGECAWTARDLFPGVFGPTTRAKLSRSELLARIEGLRDAGLTTKAIAVELGISRSYVRDLRYDPDGEKSRERKDSYRRPCPECGELMDGSNGTGPNAPTVCSRCSLTKTHEERFWTQETIVAAFKRFHELFGRSPTGADRPGVPSLRRKLSDERNAEIDEVVAAIERGDLRMPTPGIVSAEFEGGWKEALVAAGLPVNRTGGAAHRTEQRRPSGRRQPVVEREPRFRRIEIADEPAPHANGDEARRGPTIRIEPGVVDVVLLPARRETNIQCPRCRDFAAYLVERTNACRACTRELAGLPRSDLD